MESFTPAEVHFILQQQMTATDPFWVTLQKSLVWKDLKWTDHRLGNSSMLNPRPTNVMWWPKMYINAEVWGRKGHQSDSPFYLHLFGKQCQAFSLTNYIFVIMAGPCSWNVFSVSHDGFHREEWPEFWDVTIPAIQPNLVFDTPSAQGTELSTY